MTTVGSSENREQKCSTSELKEIQLSVDDANQNITISIDGCHGENRRSHSFSGNLIGKELLSKSDAKKSTSPPSVVIGQETVRIKLNPRFSKSVRLASTDSDESLSEAQPLPKNAATESTISNPSIIVRPITNVTMCNVITDKKTTIVHRRTESFKQKKCTETLSSAKLVSVEKSKEENLPEQPVKITTVPALPDEASRESGFHIPKSRSLNATATTTSVRTISTGNLSEPFCYISKDQLQRGGVFEQGNRISKNTSEFISAVPQIRRTQGFQKVTRSCNTNMAMAMESPEKCHQLSRSLTSNAQAKERGVEMFMKQRERAEKYTIDENTPRRTQRPILVVPAAKPPLVQPSAAFKPASLIDSVRDAADRKELLYELSSYGSNTPAYKRAASLGPEFKRIADASPIVFQNVSTVPASSSFNLSKQIRLKSAEPTFDSNTIEGQNRSTFCVKNNISDYPTENAMQPLYIQCNDRFMGNTFYPSPRKNFNTLPRGWKSQHPKERIL
ncbi:Synaptopodin 2-like protein [Trichinella spiralis]|uniref:Synaptopodin 2-like protein n=1 Tax=Trichinella spiralis TaxID=6334 RepID=A0ABR3L204_TRISP